MAFRYLYRDPPNPVSPVLRALLRETVVLPKFLSLSIRYCGHSTIMCLIVRAVSSPQFSQKGGVVLEMMNPWVSLLCPSRSLARVLSQRRLEQEEFGRGDRSSVISFSLLGRQRGDLHR